MGIQEVWLLIVAQQLLSASAAFCKAGSAWATSPLSKSAFSVGGQLATNFGTLAAAGVKAAEAEFATKQSSEAAFVTAANALPPIS